MMRKKYLLIYLLATIFVTLNSITVLATEETRNREETKPFVVCIDPGHQERGDSKPEAIAPGSCQTKARVSSGTQGIATKKAEYVVNLEASKILREILENKGYQVVMTREAHEVNISNAERARLSNQAGANMTVRIHCDSINNNDKSGATILVPGKESNYTKAIYPASYQFATLLKNTLTSKGVKVNGIFERSDMTGFNWSKVPVVILEMGFMSNWTEDKMLSDPAYQRKLMEGVAEAIDQYKEASQTPSQSNCLKIQKGAVALNN